MKAFFASIMLLSACGSETDKALSEQIGSDPEATETKQPDSVTDEEIAEQRQDELLNIYNSLANEVGYDGRWALERCQDTYDMLGPYTTDRRVYGECIFTLKDMGEYYIVDVDFDCELKRYTGDEIFVLEEFSTEAKVAESVMLENPTTQDLKFVCPKVTSKAMACKQNVMYQGQIHQLDLYFKKID